MLGDENSIIQNCAVCDRYTVQSYYKHRLGYEQQSKQEFPQIDLHNPGEFKVVVEDAGHWTPYKGLLVSKEAMSEGNLKGRVVKVGIVHVSNCFSSYLSRLK